MISMFDPWSDLFAPRPQQQYGRRGGGFFGDYDDYYAQQAERARYAEEMERRRRYAEEMERRRYYAEEMERRQRYAEEMERRQRYAKMMEQQQREAELARRQHYAAELERQKAAKASAPLASRRQELTRRQQQRQLLRVMTVAATIIQRAYRRHRARKQQLARAEAATRIAAWYRSTRDRRAMQATLPKLVALNSIIQNAEALWREKSPAAFAEPLREDGKPSRVYLEMSELMLRQLLRLDEISTGGNEHIRALRKSIAGALNQKLDKIEAAKQAALRDYATRSDAMDVVDSHPEDNASEDDDPSMSSDDSE